MSMVKVIEVLAQSDKGFDDAARNAVRIAAKTVRDIKEIYIKDMNGIVENGEIKLYRITAKISFLLSE
ncbi:MAG: dodecin family protein [Paracoccaceae bacterium]|jgi:flavin-binding protein dodecin